jgi:hypothetical protein
MSTQIKSQEDYISNTKKVIKHLETGAGYEITRVKIRVGFMGLMGLMDFLEIEIFKLSIQ